MRPLIGLALFVWVFSPVGLTFGDEVKPTDSIWMSYYYIFDGEDQIPIALSKFANDGMLTDGDKIPIIASFFSQIFKKNPDQALVWIQEANLDDEHVPAMILAYLLADLRNHASKLVEEIGHSDSQKRRIMQGVPGQLSVEIESPIQLDMLWAAFMASGEPRFVDKIMSTLSLPRAGDAKTDAELLLVAKAAAWSLGSNIKLHELVRRIVERRLSTADSQLRQRLTKILAFARSKRQKLPAQNGDFSGALLVTRDMGFYETWRNTPIRTEPLLQTTSEARRGDVVGIPLVFTGAEMTEDFRVRVTFDITITKPDGSIYFEGSDIVALDRKAPARFIVFLSDSDILMEIEQDDPLGTYGVTATLTDEIGQRSVRMQTTIDVTE